MIVKKIILGSLILFLFFVAVTESGRDLADYMVEKTINGYEAVVSYIKK